MIRGESPIKAEQCGFQFCRVLTGLGRFSGQVQQDSKTMVLYLHIARHALYWASVSNFFQNRRTFLLTSPQESNKSQKDLQQEFPVEDAKLTCWVQRFSGGTTELSEGEAMQMGALETETCTVYFQPAESILSNL